MYSFQDEIGEGGLKHLQWYFCGGTQYWFQKLQKEFTGVHFEVARSPKHSFEYCRKEESRDPDGLHESSELSPASPAGNCGGGGSKYAELLRRIREDATLDDLEREFPGIVFGRRNDVLGALARQRAVRQLAHEKQYFREHGRLPTQRAKCQILWGPPGGGKSTIIKGRALQLADEHGLRIYQLRDGKWFQDYQGEEIIIINDMSPFRFDQSWMLDLMDGHNVWFPCKGGGFYGDIDYVFIDSNYDPDCWFAKKLDAPTPQELERAAAIRRRCNEGLDVFRIDNPLLAKQKDKRTLYDRLKDQTVARSVQLVGNTSDQLMAMREANKRAMEAIFRGDEVEYEDNPAKVSRQEEEPITEEERFAPEPVGPSPALMAAMAAQIAKYAD